MTAAMIDRLAHHEHLLVFEGESYRTNHALIKRTLKGDDDETAKNAW
jgi:DNA replication protein DnaC